MRVRVTGLGCPVWWDLSVDESFRTVRELVGRRTGMELACIGLETEGRLVEDKLLVGCHALHGYVTVAIRWRLPGGSREVAAGEPLREV